MPVIAIVDAPWPHDYLTNAIGHDVSVVVGGIYRPSTIRCNANGGVSRAEEGNAGGVRT
jgi:hypothetical protein